MLREGGISDAPRRSMLMPPIGRYMTKQPWTISAHQKLTDAHQLMHAHGIRHLPVVDDGKLVGILSDRDLRLVEAVGGRRAGQIHDAMTEPVYAVDPLAQVDEVAREMSEHKYGSAVVMNADGVVVGIFTMVDACRALAEVLDRAAA